MLPFLVNDNLHHLVAAFEEGGKYLVKILVKVVVKTLKILLQKVCL